MTSYGGCPPWYGRFVPIISYYQYITHNPKIQFEIVIFYHQSQEKTAIQVISNRRHVFFYCCFTG